MFPDLTGDQRALRAELRSYFSTLISPAEREIMLTERHGPVYREVVRRMGRDGWLGVGWPAEYGGRGLGQVEQQIFVTEAALADVPLPAVTLQTVGPTLRRTAARSRRTSSCRGSWPGSCISPSGTPSRAPAPTWRRCAPAQCSTVMTTW